MLRITPMTTSQEHITLRVEGKIASGWVSELECETKRWLESDVLLASRTSRPQGSEYEYRPRRHNQPWPPPKPWA